jgi:hypothetical protein
MEPHRGRAMGSPGRPARARRWRGYLTEDNLVSIFCPGCALREFGLRERKRRGLR